MAVFIINSELIEQVSRGVEVDERPEYTLLNFIKKFHKEIGVYPTLREMAMGLREMYPEKNYQSWLPSRLVKKLELENKITYIVSDPSKRRSYARMIVNDDAT